ncbi:ATP-binding cassette domain-containing protein [Anaerocolumna cellulosilytica]
MNDKVFCDEYNEEYFINEIQNVTFKYPNTDEPTLKDISLTISQGERIAIVGENGSGKSTLVKLLLGIYKPTEGKIISKIKIENGKSAIFQNYLGYAMSLIDNIVISDSDDKIDMDKLSRVMKQSGVSGIASKLENGFSTLLGKEFGGHELSGGELQKVALARGTYKDSDFIVFDEPTSSIDPIEESRMYDIIESITEYKTALIVTHRMGSVQFADRILVLKNGKIVEEGTHTMLLELNGEYKKLYTTQSKNYDHNYIS